LLSLFAHLQLAPSIAPCLLIQPPHSPSSGPLPYRSGHRAPRAETPKIDTLPRKKVAASESSNHQPSAASHFNRICRICSEAAELVRASVCPVSVLQPVASPFRSLYPLSLSFPGRPPQVCLLACSARRSTPVFARQTPSPTSDQDRTRQGALCITRPT
jgi:hypothetical protein